MVQLLVVWNSKLYHTFPVAYTGKIHTTVGFKSLSIGTTKFFQETKHCIVQLELLYLHI